MQIIKLNATDSTNLYLKNLMTSTELEDYTTVVAQRQYQGRGQMGTVWQSDEGKNLTFSVLKSFGVFPVASQFSLNMMVSLALHASLDSLNIPNIQVKWPNDIMSGSHKICGILIENALNGSHIKNAIIGIGLNVNQTSFGDLTKASSLHLVSGHLFDLDAVLQIVLQKLKFFLDDAKSYALPSLQKHYESVLFRKDKVSTFKRATGEMFVGIIRGVSESGLLKIELDSGDMEQFSMKEITLLY